MRRIKAEDTAPELVVRRLAHSMGFRFRLHVRKLPGRPDLVFARLRKAVLVHGCFWHWHECCKESHMPKSRPEYWAPKLEGNRRRDAENLKRLRKLGWRVLIVWECETTSTERLTKRLARFLQGPSS